MKKYLGIFVFGAVLLLGAQAYADPVTFTISSIAVSDTNSYNFSYAYVSTLPSFTLDTAAGGNPASWSGNLFQISTSSAFSNHPGDQTGQIRIDFTFSAPPGFPATFDTGTLFADYVRGSDPDHFDITWGAPITVNFGNGGVLQIDMQDIVNASAPGSTWDQGTFTLLNEPTTVPEPSTMLLLGTGLLGIGFAFRRNRNK